MIYGMIGLVLGAIVGVINYRVLKRVAEGVELPETKKLLDIVALADLALLPAIGFVIGQYVIE